MKNYKKIIILANLLVVLVFFTNSIMKKEELLSEGTLVLLELAPVDPRSLMQGDYMRLRYKISEKVNYDSISKRGYCVVKLDSNKIANRVRIQDDQLPVYDDEYLIEYTNGNWSINIGAESYFFQEGDAQKYEVAKYGGIKVDKKGNSLLIGLYDENFKLINHKR
ncbi:MAG: GDYXXLXY domain-containing protein [Bacteroidota bacterium]